MSRTPPATDISPATRVAVELFLSSSSAGTSLSRGTATAAMTGFQIGRSSVWRIWRERLRPAALATPPTPTTPQTKHTLTEVAAVIQAVPLCQWQTLRALSAATNIPKTTLCRYLSTSVIRHFVCRAKPTLTVDHKQKRLAFALGHVQRLFGSDRCCFKSMYDAVHLDEKWFNLYKFSTRFYLAANYPLPYRSTPNKRYIGKVMFLAAVARPRYDFHRKRIFDGRIGIWPIVETVAAKKKAANRPAGTPIIQNVSMTREVYVKVLREKVFPAIRARWPGKRTRIIRVQQDNAGLHVSESHTDVVATGREGSWRIEVACQPPRSPYLNVLDLGLFNSIQSLQYQKETRTTEALISAVTEAFYGIPTETINKAFLTLQKVMESVIVHEGGNDLRLPRVRQHILRGVVPASLLIPADVVRSGFEALKNIVN